jgi:hypothetical protein
MIMENVITVEAQYTNVIVKVMDNKYRKKVTASGIIIPKGGTYSSQETGQLENDLEQIIAYAEVISVGSECKFYKVGDGCYLDTRSLRPIPFMGKEFMQTNELNLVCKVVVTPQE